MSRIKKIILLVLVLFFVFTIGGFFIVPPVAKSFLLKRISLRFQRQVSIQEVTANPFKFTLTVRGIKVTDRNRPDVFLSVDEIFADLKGLSIFKWAIVTNELKIKKLYLNIAQYEDGSFNFSDLLESSSAQTGQTGSAPPPKLKLLPVSLNNISLIDGSIDFLDSSTGILHKVREMNITVPFISTMPYYVDYYILPSFSAIVNGDAYSIQGQTKVFQETRETFLDVAIKDLKIPTYLPYVPIKMNFTLLSGVMDLTSRISFVIQKNRGAVLKVSGDIALKNIDIADTQKRPLIKIPSVEISVASLEPLLQALHLSKLSVQSPNINVRRDKAGKLNLESLIPDIDSTAKKGISQQQPVKAEDNKKDKKELALSVDKIEIKDGKVFVNDAVPAEPVELQLNNLELTLEDFSLLKNAKSRLSLSFLLDKKGAVSIQGPVSVEPLSGDLDVMVKAFAIPMFQSYFTEKMAIYITGGDISSSGKLVFTKADKKDLSAAFSGNLLISDFASIDKLQGEDFLKWKALSFNSMRAGLDPVFADISGISLADFYARIIINPDGTLNLTKILEEEKDMPAAEKTAETQPEAKKGKEDAAGAPKMNNVKIGAITLQGGTIDFSDRYIKPNYSLAFNEIGGRISGVSFSENQLAEVDLKGKFNQYIPVEIKGKLRPSKENLFADITTSFKDFELSPMSPYSGKYLGYKVEKGMLSVDLKYLIDKNKLEASNTIFFDQLTLGERIESPDATKLPVRLAIALLKDRNGQIKLDIPVSGSIDDPKFSVWSIVLKILGNILVKAATSPFALLGSLFGGGEELSYLEFDYGSARLSNEGVKKTDMLVKALYEKPSIRLDAEGHVDVEKDRDGLRTYLFNRKVKAQKLNDTIKKGQPAVPVDDIKIEPKEYEKYLTAAYKAEKFEKPKNVIGLTKSLPVPEMEKLILTHTVISENDLRTLAMQRSQVVKDAILKSGKVTQDRVFIIEPKSLAPEKREKQKDSRVDFRLK